MADPVKKFSFGFTKTIRKPNLSNKLRIEPKSETQLIDCLEGKLIKVKGGEKRVEEKPLIIPLQPSSRRLLVKSENGEINPSASSQNELKPDHSENVTGKQDLQDAEEVPQPSQTDDKNMVQVKTEPPEPEPTTLEEIAAREILREAEESQGKEDHINLTLPAVEDLDTLPIEPTEEDYENIPVSAFGKAMLKGMGWREEAGIGKKPQLVAMVEATGPKRLASSAELAIRAAAAPSNSASNTEQEELKLTKGSFVKAMSGAMKGEYGEVEGFNDECDRVLVKMVLRGGTVSFSEAALQVVTKSEYLKNSRVLNSSKYEEVKNKVSQSLEESTRQPSPKRSKRCTPERRDRSPSSRGRKERSPDPRRDRSPDKRREKSPDSRRDKRDVRDRSASPEKRYKQSRKRSPSPSPDKNRKKTDSYPDKKHCRRDSPKKTTPPRTRNSPLPSPGRDSKRKNYEESSKRSEVEHEKSRQLKDHSCSRRRSDSRSVSPQKPRKPAEKSRRDPSSDSDRDSNKKVKKSSKKKHKRKSSSVSSSTSDSASPKRSSSHKKKKKSHKKKKSKKRDSSSSPVRQKKSSRK